MRYLSEQWAEAALERVESDERVGVALAGFDMSILAIILGPPKGCYGFIFVSFEDGVLKEYRVGYDFEAATVGMPKPTFVVSGEYPVFCAINQGELSEKKALISGKLHLTGGMLKALRHMSGIEAITRALNDIECTTDLA